MTRKLIRAGVAAFALLAAPMPAHAADLPLSGDIVRAGLNFKFDMGGPIVARC